MLNTNTQEFSPLDKKIIANARTAQCVAMDSPLIGQEDAVIGVRRDVASGFGDFEEVDGEQLE